jgi:RNA polymerase sigma-70 factor (ECF subfamily)
VSSRLALVSSTDVDARSTGVLVRDAQNGDRDAFGALYRRHARLVNVVLLGSVAPDDVPDLLQDVFLAALRELSRLRDPDAFGGWLAQIARNQAKMHHRSQRPLESFDDAVHGHVAAVDRAVDAGLEARSDAEHIMGHVRELPARLREPLLLRLVEGMPGEEIARVTGLSHGTVRVYLHEAMRLLRQRLEERR